MGDIVGNMVILIGIDVNKAFYKTGNEMMRPQIESSYDRLNTDDEYRNDLSIMMVVDSFFILQFIFGHDRHAHGNQIKCDILKLENHIPLFVLKEVFDKVEVYSVLIHMALCMIKMQLE